MIIKTSYCLNLTKIPAYVRMTVIYCSCFIFRFTRLSFTHLAPDNAKGSLKTNEVSFGEAKTFYQRAPFSGCLIIPLFPPLPTMIPSKFHRIGILTRPNTPDIAPVIAALRAKLTA